MIQPKCPRCHEAKNQRKDGFTPSGSQRYRCKHCGCRHTPVAKERGYDEEVRMQALRLHLEGMSLRAIGRILQVNHQTAANWINGFSNFLPMTLPDSILELVEFDDLLS